MRSAIELRRIVSRTAAATPRRRSSAAAALRRTLLVLALLLLTTPSIAADSGWRIARHPSGLGLLIPGRLWVSGDVTLKLDVPEGEPLAGELDDLSLLARWEPLDRFSLFGELRLEDLAEVVEGEGFVEATTVLIERLYAEVLVTPQLSLRIGKVYTPFGLWNVISRAPLTWTVERPAITEDVFPERATGLSLLYQTTWHGWSFDATLYGPAQDEITFGNSEFGRGLLFGTRVAAGRVLGPAFASLGVNAAGFRDRDESFWVTATGLDLQIDVGGHEITGELTFRLPASEKRSEHGLYLQDAFPLVGDLYGVLRFEYFQPPLGDPAVGQLVGLFWRPVPCLVLKADYLFGFGTRRLENFEPGFRASISLLF
jgi:hypothetical protein